MWPLLVCTLLLSQSRRLRYADVMPSARPAKSMRECHVHGCELTDADRKRTRERQVPALRGHMEPMGQQQVMRPVQRSFPERVRSGCAELLGAADLEAVLQDLLHIHVDADELTGRNRNKKSMNKKSSL